jgi:hypothetical protein
LAIIAAPSQLNRYVLIDILMTGPNESEQKLVVGFAWYRPAQWQRVRDISSDADDLEDTYEGWLRLAEQKLAELRAAGLHVEKVDVDSERLIIWCSERGLEINAQARSSYAAETLREIHRDDP